MAELKKKMDVGFLNWFLEDAIEQVREMPEKGVYPIGKFIPREGVYIGQWQYKDAQNENLGKTFNVFAAPEDLSRMRGYEDTVDLLKDLKNWHGHDGAAYGSCHALYKALDQNTYKGEWVIPPSEMLANNLSPARNKGDLSGTFQAKAYGDAYWSSTNRFGASMISVNFFTGNGGLYGDRAPLHCRPVRLVEVKR